MKISLCIMVWSLMNLLDIVYKGDNFISLNFYVIGHYLNMDEMYNNLEKNKSRASIKGTLKHANKSWQINTW